MSEKTSKRGFKLPSSIVVKGARYKIIVKDNLKTDDNEDALGLCCSTDKRIYIQSGLSTQERRSVFLHELLHAYMAECNIREGLPAALEEAIVETCQEAITKHFTIYFK